MELLHNLPFVKAKPLKSPQRQIIAERKEAVSNLNLLKRENVKQDLPEN